MSPRIDPTCFIAESAAVIGDVVLGLRSSVWHNVTIRGDVNWIRIGSESNIQDNSVVHVTHRTGPVEIGDRVTIGHAAVIHACTIRDVVLVGMGSIILDGAEIGTESIVGAGALITRGVKIPPRSLVLGSPAKVVRKLSPDEVLSIQRYADNYIHYAAIYQGEEKPVKNPFR
jgi:carbonic anhydrase/acetyltransferase-like protein (isoleucine patch superfamily)